MNSTIKLCAALFVATTALACGDESVQQAREDVAAARQEAAAEVGEAREEAADVTAKAAYDVAIANADGAYKVAIERCELMEPIEALDACKRAAQAEYDSARRAAETMRDRQM